MYPESYEGYFSLFYSQENLEHLYSMELATLIRHLFLADSSALSEYGVDKLYAISHLPGFTSNNYMACFREYGITPKLSEKAIKNIVRTANGKVALETNESDKHLQDALAKASTGLNKLKRLCSDPNISNDEFRTIACRILSST